MSLLDHRLSEKTAHPRATGPNTEECRVETCTDTIFTKQVFRAPTGELCTIGVCAHHHGLEDLLPAKT